MSVKQKEKPFDLDMLSITDLPDVSETLFLEKQKTPVFGKKYIVFMINGVNYAISSDKISEVVRSLPFTALPDVPSWILGIANLRGDILSVIDLKSILKLESEDSAKSKLIVLNPAISKSHIAFRVDKVREIVTFAKDEIKPCKDAESSYFEGQVKVKSSEIYLLDVEKILTSLIIP